MQQAETAGEGGESPQGCCCGCARVGRGLGEAHLQNAQRVQSDHVHCRGQAHDAHVVLQRNLKRRRVNQHTTDSRLQLQRHLQHGLEEGEGALALALRQAVPVAEEHGAVGGLCARVAMLIAKCLLKDVQGAGVWCVHARVYTQTRAYI